MPAAMDIHRPAVKPPAGLNVKDMCNDDNAQGRDSAYFSSDTSSKHTSAASFGNALSPAHSGYHSVDKTPSPTANILPQPLVSPSTSSSMSVAAMVSPTTSAGPDPRRFDRPISVESGANGATLTVNEYPESLSRRESVDSRINQGFTDMRLGSSPYTSHNQSTVSVTNTLSTQRTPRSGLEALTVHRISNGYQPSAERNPEPNAKTVKTAPAITGPATSTIARAAEPTKGQAWAFPEEEIQRIGPSNGSFLDSRRSSIAESLASSQFTTESRLPPGQRRLDDNADGNRLSSNSSEFPSLHHHSLQLRQIGELQNEDARSQAGSQPYSRTPELRQSHKLAERKRRTEMKELFDQLRDLMPQERGSKASKWEILTKAITEYQRQNEHIRLVQSHYSSATAEVELLRREIQGLRMENAQLRGELQAHPPGAAPPPNLAPPQSSAPATIQPPPFSDPFANSSRTELPPLRALGAPLSGGPESMMDVQYESGRTNGFRNDPRY